VVTAISPIDVIFEPGALPAAYWSVTDNGTELVAGGVPQEIHLGLYVNGRDLATLMCSPLEQEALALGFLFNEGVIQSLDEVGLVRCNLTGTTVDVLLRKGDFAMPRRMVLTAGCGGGVSFQVSTDGLEPLETNFRTTPATVLERMRDLNAAARLYRQVRGIHTSVLADNGGILLMAEDVGRHNTIDKLMGKALLAGLSPRDRMVVTSGRISSEMLLKARQMGVPLVASRTAPTSISVEIAVAWNICVVGYLRYGSLRVYTCPERLGLSSERQP
jgi:FdhD protein